MPGLADAPYDRETIHALARAQKLLIYAVLAMLVGRGGGCLGTSVVSTLQPPPSTGVFLVVWTLYTLIYLGTFVFMLVAVFRFAKSMSYSTGMSVLFVFLMIVPLANLITLLVLSSKATYHLRDAGVRVGFFGVDLKRLP